MLYRVYDDESGARRVDQITGEGMVYSLVPSESDKSLKQGYYDDLDEVEVEKAYNPNQPREPKGSPIGGQFRSTGASSTTDPQKPDTESRMAEILRLQQKVAEDQFYNSLPDDIKAKIDWAEAELAKNVRTVASVEDGGFMDKNGKWLKEREKIHDEILAEFFNEEAVRRATPAPGEAPEFIMLGGRPGAGKSTALNSGTFPIDQSKYLTINADEFQAKLPGYQPHLAGVYSPEGQYLAERAEKLARDNGLNVIYDATMKSTDPAVKRAKELKDAGYKTSVYFVHVRPEISASRAMQRFANPKDGRYVPISVLVNALTNERTFAEVRPLVDRWALFDGNNKAELVAQGGK